MTNPTPHGQVPEALRLADVCRNLTRYSMDAHLIDAELRRQHDRITELEARLEAIGAGGVQALSAAPGVGNSGFDHKTVADLLNNKTVSDDAVRKFVQASRWAHDERAALSATLLAMHGVLTSREAEIALLKKALLEAETTPQPAPAPLNEREAFEAWIEKDGGDLGTFGVPPNTHYRNSAVNNAWVAWKARAALAAQGGE